MKKLASLLTLFSLGLLAVGCNTDEGAAPSPDMAPSVEGSSVGPAGDMADESATDTTEIPPVTDEIPPVTEEVPPTTDETAPAETPTPAEGDASTTDETLGTDPVEPTPAEGETAPE